MLCRSLRASSSVYWAWLAWPPLLADVASKRSRPISPVVILLICNTRLICNTVATTEIIGRWFPSFLFLLKSNRFLKAAVALTSPQLAKHIFRFA